MTVKIVKLIDSNQYISEIKPYGSVDLRTEESETEEEKQAARESLKDFNFTVDGKNILRLVSIFENKTLKGAILDSELLFEGIIDLLKLQPIAEIKYCNGAGYWVNMDIGETVPIQKPRKIEYFPPMHSYQLSLGPYSPMFGEQYISSKRDEEATKAFIRSIHWFNDGASQNRVYLQFLYKWIAIETITKINENDFFIPKLCLALGFPFSNHSQINSKSKIEQFMAIDKYRNYRKIIWDNFDECRIIRNEIVHSGLKEINLLGKNIELKLYLINSAYSWMLSNIEKIIFTGKNTLKEIWDEMCVYVMKDEILLKWTSGTFINHIDDFLLCKEE